MARSDLPTYEELAATCADQQSQIIRSMVVKQDLIDARNRLDHDLARFQAIQQYSRRSVQAENLEALGETTVESIIEAFEWECSGLLLYGENRSELRMVSSFGIDVPEDGCILPAAWIEEWGFNRDGSARIVQVTPDLSPWHDLELRQIILSPFYAKLGELEGLLIGGISKAKSPFYEEISDEVVPSFIVFTQQMSAMYHNLRSQKVIRDQLRALGDANKELHIAQQQLARTNEGLERARDGLELRVKERTSELSNINTLLEREVDERKRIERELQKAKDVAENANRAKSDFLANMSHELRTPMNAVIGFSEMILDGVYGDAAPEIAEAVFEIQNSGEHLLKLINDVLDISKIEAGRMELRFTDNAPEECIESVVSRMKSLADEKNLSLTTEVCEELPIFSFDFQRISQVITNLVGNAIKFTREGEVRIGARAKEETLVCWVSDTGVGIPAHDISVIFDEFLQADSSMSRESQGTGLGLAISKRFVEMHGGRIWVESTVNAGSTFWFSLPLRRKV